MKRATAEKATRRSAVFSQSSLYECVANDIRSKIATGEWKAGERLASISELCDQYGVSNITIRGAIRRLAEEGVIVSEERKGIFVAEHAQPRTGVIGCYGFQHTMRLLPYYFHLFKGLQRGAERAGYEILILDANAPSISWEKIDGLVLAVAEDDKVVRRLPPGMCSVALLHPSPGFPSVLSDDYSGMRQAVDHLFEYGHRKIAYLYEEDDLTSIRLSGYRDALTFHGIKPKASWEYTLIPHHVDEFRGRGRESMRNWLRSGWSKTGCTALICQNDRTAIGVLEALREAGIRSPEEVSLVGFDSTDECDVVTPKLTSIKVPLEEMGEKAVEVLFDAMKGEARNGGSPQKILLPTHIERRESVAPPVAHS